MDRIKEWINDYEAILGYAKWLIIFRGLSLEYFIALSCDLESIILIFVNFPVIL